MKREKLDLTQESGYEALKGHVVSKAQLARERHGPTIDLQAMHAILEDRDVVRHPTQLVFDASQLKTGEFAHVQLKRAADSRGYELLLHPRFEGRSEALPLLIAYHLPSVNYSDLATHEEAELFGATLFGMQVDAYYEAVCQLADEVAEG